MRIVQWCLCLGLTVCLLSTSAQTDTSFIYNPQMPYGELDIRVARSNSNTYHLIEGQTFSFRESSPGVKTSSHLPMLKWDTSPYEEGHLREIEGARDQFVMNYRLLRPTGYDHKYHPGYPLAVIMHGAGSTGNCWERDCFWATKGWNPRNNTPPAPTGADHPLLNNDESLFYGARPQLQARSRAGTMYPDDPAMPSGGFQGFTLVPQNLNGWTPEAVEDVIRIVRLLTRKYNIDENRIYVYGLSNGGMGTFELIKRAPWLFAAAIPMSSPTDGGIIQHGLSETIAAIPLWIFQGGLDTNPPPSRTRGYISKLQQAGARPRYTEYVDLGHGILNVAIKEPDFFSWLLAQNKSNIHVFAGDSTICPESGKTTELSFSEGFFHYQWELDGQIIADSTRHTFVARQPGVYRGRFSRVKNPGPDDWNQWSKPVEIRSVRPDKPEIKLSGTRFLPDLNGKNEVTLSTEQPYAFYYWERNGSPVTLNGSQGQFTLKAQHGSGAWAVTTEHAQGCPGPASDPVRIFFNNEAPASLTPPRAPEARAVNNNTIRLSWKGNAAGATGVEIWRRAWTTNGYEPWKLVTIATPHSNTYDDTVPSSAEIFQYKIRAIGEAVRSEYAPTQALTVHRVIDTQAPSAPVNLTAQPGAMGVLNLSWTPAQDNTGVLEYVIHLSDSTLLTNSDAARYTLQNLPLNKSYTVAVRARDRAGNVSPPSIPIRVNTYFSGLYYTHGTGTHTSLSQINWSAVKRQGRTRDFDLTPRIQDDHFWFAFDGFINIRRAGQYIFQLGSDEGSRLTLNGQLLIGHDGIHTFSRKTSQPVSLTKGAHRIFLQYFEHTGDERLEVSYSGPDTHGQMMPISAAALNSGDPIDWDEVISILESRQQRRDAFVLGVEDPGPLNALIFPNPARMGDDITITLKVATPAPLTVRLVDINGRLLYNEKWSPGMSTEIRIAPYQRLHPGMYVVVVEMGDAVLRKKLVVR